MEWGGLCLTGNGFPSPHLGITEDGGWIKNISLKIRVNSGRQMFETFQINYRICAFLSGGGDLAEKGIWQNCKNSNKCIKSWIHGFRLTKTYGNFFISERVMRFFSSVPKLMHLRPNSGKTRTHQKNTSKLFTCFIACIWTQNTVP